MKFGNAFWNLVPNWSISTFGPYEMWQSFTKILSINHNVKYKPFNASKTRFQFQYIFVLWYYNLFTLFLCKTHKLQIMRHMWVHLVSFNSMYYFIFFVSNHQALPKGVVYIITILKYLFWEFSHIDLILPTAIFSVCVCGLP